MKEDINFNDTYRNLFSINNTNMLQCYTDSTDMVIIKALCSQEYCTYMFIQDGKYITL